MRRGQTLDHQRSQAEAAGFRLHEVVADHGISGVQTALRARPEGRRLFDMLRTGDTLVVRWVDRLGRNYADVTDTIRDFIRRGIIIRTVINGLVFDGMSKDPMTQAVRVSLIAFMAAMAQAQAEVTKEAQKAGIAHAKANDDGTKYRGRKPTFTCEQFDLEGSLETVFTAGQEVVRWTDHELVPPILKRAAELFQDGLTVREVAAALKISKSEAGRLRLRWLENTNPSTRMTLPECEGAD